MIDPASVCSRILSEYGHPSEYGETVYRWPMDQVRALQEQRFRETVAWAWQLPFYRRRWRAVGLEPGDIRSLDDLTKIPVFTVDDLRASIERHPPYGEHQFRSPEDLREQPFKLHTSGGTVGTPRPALYGLADWELQGLLSGRSLHLLGARPGDVFQIPLTCSLANMGWAFYEGAFKWVGCTALTTGSGAVTPSRKQLEIASAYGTNCWVSFPEYMLRLADVADEMGYDLARLPTKFIVSALGPDTDGRLRATVERRWHADVYDIYGTNEIGRAAFECAQKDGLHISEDTVLLEVLDVETGRPVPDGQVGNLVATVLWRRHPTFVRFNLLDLSRIVSSAPCRCGSRFRRMDHMLGRSDQMVKIRGNNIFPMACLRAVQSVAGTTGEWLCVAHRRGRDPGDADALLVRVECEPSVPVGQAREALLRGLHADLGLRVEVELVEPGSLAPFTGVGGEGKPRRLLDLRRTGEAPPPGRTLPDPTAGAGAS